MYKKNNMWQIIKAWFIQDTLKPLVLPEKIKYKKQDTTPITQGMYDLIMLAHNEKIEYNKLNTCKRTTDDVCAYVNLCCGTNFGRTKISKVWLGKLDREKLPESKTYNREF